MVWAAPIRGAYSQRGSSGGTETKPRALPRYGPRPEGLNGRHERAMKIFTKVRWAPSKVNMLGKLVVLTARVSTLLTDVSGTFWLWFQQELLEGRPQNCNVPSG
jgi:hypothetical protein